jgi:hypothetical protein
MVWYDAWMFPGHCPLLKPCLQRFRGWYSFHNKEGEEIPTQSGMLNLVLATRQLNELGWDNRTTGRHEVHRCSM